MVGVSNVLLWYHDTGELAVFWVAPQPQIGTGEGQDAGTNIDAPGYDLESHTLKSEQGENGYTWNLYEAKTKNATTFLVLSSPEFDQSLVQFKNGKALQESAINLPFLDDGTKTTLVHERRRTIVARFNDNDGKWDVTSWNHETGKRAAFGKLYDETSHSEQRKGKMITYMAKGDGATSFKVILTGENPEAKLKLVPTGEGLEPTEVDGYELLIHRKDFSYAIGLFTVIKWFHKTGQVEFYWMIPDDQYQAALRGSVQDFGGYDKKTHTVSVTELEEDFDGYRLFYQPIQGVEGASPFMDVISIDGQRMLHAVDSMSGEPKWDNYLEFLPVEAAGIAASIIHEKDHSIVAELDAFGVKKVSKWIHATSEKQDYGDSFDETSHKKVENGNVITYEAIIDDATTFKVTTDKDEQGKIQLITTDPDGQEKAQKVLSSTFLIHKKDFTYVMGFNSVWKWWHNNGTYEPFWVLPSKCSVIPFPRLPPQVQTGYGYDMTSHFRIRSKMEDGSTLWEFRGNSTIPGVTTFRYFEDPMGSRLLISGASNPDNPQEAKQFELPSNATPLKENKPRSVLLHEKLHTIIGEITGYWDWKIFKWIHKTGKKEEYGADYDEKLYKRSEDDVWIYYVSQDPKFPSFKTEIVKQEGNFKRRNQQLITMNPSGDDVHIAETQPSKQLIHKQGYSWIMDLITIEKWDHRTGKIVENWSKRLLEEEEMLERKAKASSGDLGPDATAWVVM